MNIEGEYSRDLDLLDFSKFLKINYLKKNRICQLMSERFGGKNRLTLGTQGRLKSVSASQG